MDSVDMVLDAGLMTEIAQESLSFDRTRQTRSCSHTDANKFQHVPIIFTLSITTVTTNKEMATTIKSNPASSSKSSGKKSNGAPAQHKQGSRKGKRSWRKNVDIGEVEEGMEEMRAEERVAGCVHRLIRL